MSDDVLVQELPMGLRTASPFDEESPEVLAVIERARAHPLGLDLLREGYLDSVAATFQTHAFVVEAARRRLTR